MDPRLTAASVFNLMRTLPPAQVPEAMDMVSQLIQDEKLRDQIQDSVDRPLETELDTSNGRPFIRHEFNKDGDSYRSPWSNQYYPPKPEATFFPSATLATIE